MTEQQTHLKSCVEQQRQLVGDIQNLNNQLTEKREIALKLQGIIEYLTGQGVELPTDDEAQTESPGDSTGGKVTKADE
jgi:hypothetical protein